MELIDKIKSKNIYRAVEIAMQQENSLIEISEGWSKVSQVAHMEKHLSRTTKQLIEKELPSLRYWISPRTPQNPSTEGYICDSDNAGISFPGIPDHS